MLSGFHIVQWSPAGGQAGVQRAFPQQLGGETVDGLDGRLVQFVAGNTDALPLRVGQVFVQQVSGVVGMLVVQQLLHTGTDALGEFRRRRFGKGDGNDVGHRHAVFHQRDDAADQGVGFASAGAGLNDKVGVQVADDAPGSFAVVSWRRHLYSMAALPPRALKG